MTNRKLSIVSSALFGGLLAVAVSLTTSSADNVSYPFFGVALLWIIYSVIMWICLFADNIDVIRTRRYLISLIKSVAFGSLLAVGGIGALALIEYGFNDTRLTFNVAGIILLIIIFSGAPLHGIFNPKKISS